MKIQASKGSGRAQGPGLWPLRSLSFFFMLLCNCFVALCSCSCLLLLCCCRCRCRRRRRRRCCFDCGGVFLVRMESPCVVLWRLIQRFRIPPLGDGDPERNFIIIIYVSLIYIIHYHHLYQLVFIYVSYHNLLLFIYSDLPGYVHYHHQLCQLNLCY